MRRHSAVVVALMSDNTHELAFLSDEERQRVIADAGYGGAKSVIKTEIPTGQCCHPDCNNQSLYEIFLKLSVPNHRDSFMTVGLEACKVHRKSVLATAKKERSVEVICQKWERPTRVLMDDVRLYPVRR
jgi:hypothetical protein